MPLSEARKKERKIAENRAELGVCLIAKRLRGPYRAVFSGCVVKSLFPNWRRKFCIITSGKIDLTEQYYLLCFRELDSELALIKVKLENVFCSESNVEYLSGLAIIPLDDSKLTNFFIKSSILTYRPFTVNKEESLDGSVCYIVDGYPDVFAVKAYDLEYLNGEYILKLPERGEQDATFKTFSELTAQGSNNLHPDGAVILKNVDNTLMAVGALAFVDDKISPVAFSQLQEFRGGGRQNISPTAVTDEATALISEESEEPGDILDPSSRQRWNNDVGIQTDVGHEGGGGRQNISPTAITDEATALISEESEEPGDILEHTHSRLDYLAPLRFVLNATLDWTWRPIVTQIGSIICRRTARTSCEDRKNEPNGSVSEASMKIFAREYQLPEANGVNYPTQETDLHASQNQGAPEYHPTYQEAGGDQACGYTYPVQETGQVAVQIPGEHEDLGPYYQPLNCTVNFRYQTEEGLEPQLVPRLGLEEFDRGLLPVTQSLHRSYLQQAANEGDENSQFTYKGPLLPKDLDVQYIPLQQIRNLSVHLCGGNEWMIIAERLGLTQAEIRFLAGRSRNPFEDAVMHIRSQQYLNVGQLYDVMVNCGFPTFANLL
ncbi:uncharacterized protein LOC144628824 [Oculina patagonica]